MTEMKEYILTVVTVCFLCGMTVHLTDRFKSTGPLIRILCGILTATTFFAPIFQLKWNDLTGYLDKMELEAQSTAADGYFLYQQSRTQSISAEIQAYILDKASQYGCELQVQLKMSEEDPPLPVAVSLQGAVSPYQRKQLSDMIEKELGIPKEMQTWNETK